MTAGVHADATISELGGQLGKYQLIRRLATGGMAELFLARATAIHGFEKVVVLKRILPQHAENEDFIRMFLAEARLAATLHHPNIVQVYDIGEDNGTYFFTMEYVQGVDLRKLVRSARKKSMALPLEHILHVIMGMAAGLNHAHEKVGLDGKPLGIVHRDVSPSNVLVTFEGGVKIVDFGIAKAASAQVATIAGTLKGKIPYMSPEQCRGEGVDRRSDIFSIGTLLWELTTGTRLFAGDNEFAILNRVAKGDVPTPSSIRPDYPPELEAIVMKALHSDPEMRYKTALDLQIDLEDFSREARLPVSSARLGRFMRELCAEEIAKIASQLAVEREEAATVPQPVLSATAVVTPAANDPVAAAKTAADGGTAAALVESASDLTPSELRGAPLMPTPGPGDYGSSVTEVPIDELPGHSRPGVAVAIVVALLAVVGLGAGGWYMFNNGAAADTSNKAPPKVIEAPATLPDPNDEAAPDSDDPAPVDMSPAPTPIEHPEGDDADADPDANEGDDAAEPDSPPDPEVVVDEAAIEVEDSADAGDDGTSEDDDDDADKSRRHRRPGSSKKQSKPATSPKKKPQWDPNVGIPGL